MFNRRVVQASLVGRGAVVHDRTEVVAPARVWIGNDDCHGASFVVASPIMPTTTPSDGLRLLQYNRQEVCQAE